MNSQSWSPFSAPLLYDMHDSASEIASFQYSLASNVPVDQFKGTLISLLAIINKTKLISFYFIIGFERVSSTSYTLTENKSFTNQNQQVIGTKSDLPNQFCSKLPKRSDKLTNLTDFIRHAEKQKAISGRVKVCSFCKTNGESEQVYTSHSLKNANDKITCPILLDYECPVCGAKGEKSHTKKYCPVLQKKMRLQMLEKIGKEN